LNPDVWAFVTKKIYILVIWMNFDKLYVGDGLKSVAQSIFYFEAIK